MEDLEELARSLIVSSGWSWAAGMADLEGRRLVLFEPVLRWVHGHPWGGKAYTWPLEDPALPDLNDGPTLGSLLFGLLPDLYKGPVEMTRRYGLTPGWACMTQAYPRDRERGRGSTRGEAIARAVIAWRPGDIPAIDPADTASSPPAGDRSRMTAQQIAVELGGEVRNGGVYIPQTPMVDGPSVGSGPSAMCDKHALPPIDDDDERAVDDLIRKRSISRTGRTRPIEVGDSGHDYLGPKDRGAAPASGAFSGPFSNDTMTDLRKKLVSAHAGAHQPTDRYHEVAAAFFGRVWADKHYLRSSNTSGPREDSPSPMTREALERRWRAASVYLGPED